MSNKSKKIIYISDFLYPDIVGGGELNDYELLEIFKKQGFSVIKKKSHEVDMFFLNKNKKSWFIVSNFINLKKQSRAFIEEKTTYVIYEHDHKYLRNRNPAAYENFFAPRSEIINFNFYKNAKKIFCQTTFHKNILQKNISVKNVVSLSGNLWDKKSLDVMEGLCENEKQDCFSILESATWHKNTQEAVLYCKMKNYNYKTVSSSNYHHFLSLLGRNNKFIFLPKTPETLSRVVVEARMMGLKTITNKNIGAVHEPWYHLRGKTLINVMREKRMEIPKIVLEALNE